MSQVWRKCSSCKKDIRLNETYYVCSVSTCRGNATNYVFCSVSCWDAHVPVERHRPESAGAIEKQAPRELEPEAVRTTQRKVVGSAPSPTGKSTVEDEILVVVSKVRKYIADKSGMNTSASAYDALTERVKGLCEAAIQTARSQGRKTVMDRDFP